MASALSRFEIGVILTLLGGLGCAATGEDHVSAHSQEAIDSSYDAALAERLGADEYGMRSYVVAFLKAGPNRDVDSTTRMEIQRAHLDNISRMADEGSLLLAGPFLDGGSLRGLYVFNVTSLGEARELTETDPAIQRGVLEMELHPWYGSAALAEVYRIHSRISQRDP